MTTVATSNLIFDSIRILSLVEKDKDLLGILKGEVNIDIPMLKTMAQQGSLPKKVEDILESIFSIILYKKDYSDLYATIEETTTAQKKRKLLPRRYGKVQVLEDIKKAGGKSNDIQRALLSVNELKNLYVSITNRCITDYFNDNKKLSDADYRDIKAAVDSMKKKFKPLLSKK